jgi:predicted cupin superfamily sugar epimerase
MNNAAFWIERLNLQPHPEGGFYKETFRSEKEVVRVGADERGTASTSIYYLLENGDFSGFHRIQSDELWYFHKGGPLIIHIIDDSGIIASAELSDTQTGSLSFVVPAHLWFAAEPAAGSAFALVSCAVAPGFQFSEFEMADKDQMLQTYPQHRELLKRLCR